MWTTIPGMCCEGGPTRANVTARRVAGAGVLRGRGPAGSADARRGRASWPGTSAAARSRWTSRAACTSCTATMSCTAT